MTSRFANRVILLTGVALLIPVLALAAVPAAARADDGGDREWKHGRKHGRHGWWARPPRAVVVAPAPVVVAPPVVVVPRVVVPARPVYVWVEGYYETRQETRYVPGPAVAVRVPPRFELRLVAGRFVSFEVSPGHYEYRPGPAVAVTEAVQVWVPGRWVPAARAASRGDGY